MNDRGPTGLVPVANGEADRSGPQLTRVFAFGALLDEEFVERLLEHPVPCEPARLPGYRAARLAEVDWSVLLPDEGSAVEGRVHCDLSDSDLERLDAYGGVGEGLYRRVEVSICIGREDDDEVLPAYAYLPTRRTLLRCGLG